MTSTRQRSRSAVVEEQSALAGWTTLFPAKQETELQSLTFVKKLVSATMSTVTYLRNVFDEKAYNKKSLDGVPLRILNSRTSCDKAKTFGKWLLGAFEAIEKKYLRELALVIYEDAAHPEEVKEVYTVKVSYPGGLPSCKVSGVSGVVQDHTKNLLQAILAHTQGLAPLPTNAYLSLRLEYYEEVTPPDYEPTGFSSTELQLPLGHGAELGRVATDHHALAFKVHAPHLSPEGAGALVNDALPSQSQSTAMGDSQADTPADAAASALPSTSRAAAMTHGSSQDLPASQDLDNPLAGLSLASLDMKDLEAAEAAAPTVTCTCGSGHTDPLMLVCAHCGTSQHAACYRILLQAEVPAAHCCLPCATAGRRCTDPKLQSMAARQGILFESEVPAAHCCLACATAGHPCTDCRLAAMAAKQGIENTLLYRRILAALASLTKDQGSRTLVSENLLSSRLGVAEDVATAAIKKLQLDGVIGRDYVVDKEQLQTVALPRYLKKGSKKRSREAADVAALVQEAGDMKIAEEKAKRRKLSKSRV